MNGNKILFACSIFLSAFLLFFIQPLLAKALLPAFGGAGFVWVTCMLFFQIGLLIGYAYAYFLTKHCSERQQAFIHFFFLLLSFYFIPIDLEIVNAWQESGWPPFEVIKGLSLCVLIPFAVISASSPLLQHWYYVLQKTPYPFYYYSISNAGSLIGLLGYPFIVEPLWGLMKQGKIWSGLYLSYAVLCSICLFKLIKANTKEQTSDKSICEAKQVMKWLGLTMLSSAFLVSTTRYLSQNVVNFPLVWVCPLALYLISFIFTFAKPTGYRRFDWLMIFLIFSTIGIIKIYLFTLSNWDGVICLFVLLYSGCMICHGELIRARPVPSALTLFYLYIALGGALGGALSNTIAFIPFARWWDFFLPLVCINVITIGLMWHEQFTSPVVKKAVLSGSALILVGWFGVSHYNTLLASQKMIYQHRNVYGYMRIYDTDYSEASDNKRILLHGTILHGTQFLDPAKKDHATTYYTRFSGVGLAIHYLQTHLDHPINVAAIGLGTGTVAMLLEPGDKITFFELDPEVKKIANKYFSFLKNSPATIDIVLGDGRLQLEKYYQKNKDKKFDLIVVDAFSGDAIPAHLITKEAMALYTQLLSSEGMVAFHVSNRYINLIPVTHGLATHYGYDDRWTLQSPANVKLGASRAEWVILSPYPYFFLWVEKFPIISRLPTQQIKPLLWTDDQNNVLPLLKF